MRRKNNLLNAVIFITCALSNLASAEACPNVHGFVDMNCDGKYRVVFTGDSIVYGRGDYSHHNRGGYPARVKEQYPRIGVVNFGLPGFTSGRLLSGFKRYLTRPKAPVLMRRADLIMIDVGRNDWWKDIPPGMVVRNIVRLVKLFRDYYSDKRGTTPLIVVSTLIPSSRSGQRSYVAELNNLLLTYRSKSLPVRVRFDRMNPKYLISDQVHPNSKGYNYLGRVACRFLSGRAQVLCANKRPDRDSDGIYDVFEGLKFGTDPDNPDTDGDTYSDGQEVFEMETDPLDPFDPPPPTPEPTPEPTETPTPEPTPEEGGA